MSSAQPPRRGAVAAGAGTPTHRRRRRPVWALLLLGALAIAGIAVGITQCSGGSGGAPTAAPSPNPAGNRSPVPLAPGAAAPGAAVPGAASPVPPGAAPSGTAPSGGNAAGSAAAGGVGAGALQSQIGQIVAAAPVTFTADTTALTGTGAASIDHIAQLMATAPLTRVTVTGYTAPVDGDPARCQRLSEQRADAVAQRLARDGIAPQRIQTRGASHSNPQPTWDASRRAEFTTT